MFTPGMQVRRVKRRQVMVVLAVDNNHVLCGWSAQGRFFQRRFSAAVLKPLLTYSLIWPLT